MNRRVPEAPACTDTNCWQCSRSAPPISGDLSWFANGNRRACGNTSSKAVEISCSGAYRCGRGIKPHTKYNDSYRVIELHTPWLVNHFDRVVNKHPLSGKLLQDFCLLLQKSGKAKWTLYHLLQKNGKSLRGAIALVVIIVYQ